MRPLYPTPKTQSERDAADAARKDRQRKRLPKVPWLIIPLTAGLVCWVLLEFMRITPGMWESGSQAFIFFTFAMWLGVCSLFFAWAVYAHRALYAHGKPLDIFWVGVAMIVASLFLTQQYYVSMLHVSVAFAVLLFLWCGLFFLLGRESRVKTQKKK